MLFNISIPPLIICLVFLGAGIILLKYPDKVRRYDTRMTRYIKDEEEYVIFSRIFGLIFLVLCLGALFLALLPKFIKGK